MIYKAIFTFLGSKPEGGTPVWQEEIRLFDADNAIELETKIKQVKDDSKSGYRKYIDLKSIEKL